MSGRKHTRKHREEAFSIITDEGFSIQEFRPTKNGHIKVQASYMGEIRTLTVPISGLAQRGRLNFRAQLRRTRQDIEENR